MNDVSALKSQLNCRNFQPNRYSCFVFPRASCIQGLSPTSFGFIRSHNNMAGRCLIRCSLGAGIHAEVL
jgi:hypothetical protein